MLSTVLEALGLAIITAGVTIGVLLVVSVGFAVIAGSVLAGGSLLLVGTALSTPNQG